MTPSKGEHPLHETSTKPVATGGIPMVEKLRRSVTNTTAFCPAPSYRNPDGPAAADLIEQLVEALEPFALAADDLDDAHGDYSEIWEASAAMSITAGDLRRARNLVSAARGESGK